MKATIRSFTGADLLPVVAVWNAANHADPITVARFRNLILADPNFDASGLQVAEVNGEVVGALYGVRRLTAHFGSDLQAGTGWIPFFAVHPEHQRAGIGTKLFEAARLWFSERGVNRVHFSSYTPNYIVPGLDREAYPGAVAWLTALGFTVQYEAVAMDRLLVDYRMPEHIAQHIQDLRGRGYELRAATDQDVPELISLAGDSFNPDWARGIREALTGGLGIDAITIARTPEGPLVGWAMHGTYEGMTERFGPFGVRDDQRGTGLGKVLLHLTLEHMRASGAHNAWFLWTDENSPAGHLYRATGFSVTRRFSVMTAALSS